MAGPGSERYGDIEEEIISESPLERYSIGILYPQNQNVRIEEENDDTGQNHISDGSDKTQSNEHLDNAINISNQYYPSALGMSFYVNGMCPSIEVQINTAIYRKPKPNECYAYVEYIPESVKASYLFDKKLHYSDEDKTISLIDKITKEEREGLLNLFNHDGYKNAIYKLYEFLHNGYKRIPLYESIIIPEDNTENIIQWEKEIMEGLNLFCVRRPDKDRNITLFTITLINTNKSKREKSCDECFFQTHFKARAVNSSTEFLDYNIHNKYTDELEELSNAMLYRNYKTYATGHGCAVSWSNVDSDRVNELNTEIIPYKEVPQLKFEINEISDILPVLSMKNLSDLSTLSKTEIIDLLFKFCQKYDKWIQDTNKLKDSLDSDFIDVANRHLNNCSIALKRMKVGVDLLNTDENVFRSFQLANTAMYMQRLHSELQSQLKYPNEDAILWPRYKEMNDEKAAKAASWRPFQLAFILLNIEGIANKESEDRDITDLIWFPTGGGKTEAYLGVSAYTIFLRRITKKELSGGTTIIMRYTLRLLTSQQFQRASTLICACEKIRKENPEELGKDTISIGLWIGSDSTPNEINEALRVKDKLVAGTEDKNPFQVLNCPWCGTKLSREKIGKVNKGSWGYKKGLRPKRFIIHCTELTCDFNNELPIRIVDEDIYNNPPTLLFGTVDKFALMPWKKEISNIFALDDNNENLTPELIIQDELHLISGPLGTVVGLYETALDALCSAKGVKPKIIASTATIRRAEDQVKALYNRSVSQFPPPGINAEDSFYARQDSLEEKPGRLYAGILSTGRTLTTTQIRAMAALLQYMKELDYSEEVLDKYWTLVGYFNTLKDIGKTSTLADDDIKDQVRRISRRRRVETRVYYEAEELTSRKKAEEIPKILEKLNVAYPSNAIEILLASNMISVGVDVDRLGLMIVVNQPKTTSEYIQATSRVGRKYPGLIFTLYDGARSRDRSHYEMFTAYHQAFYRYVEPTSVTPFSGPARDRGLHAVLVTLVRHWAGLRKDNDAIRFSRDALEKIVEYIQSRVNDVMTEETDNTMNQLNYLIDFWLECINNGQELTYSTGEKDHLLYTAGKKNDKHWETLQSMRNVDVDCNVTVLE